MLFPDPTPIPCSETWGEVPEATPQNAYWNFSTLDPSEGEEGRPEKGMGKLIQPQRQPEQRLHTYPMIQQFYS